MMNIGWKTRLIVPLAWTGLFAFASGGKLAGADYPSAEISNGQIQVKLYLPEAKDGYYRGTRFDWSGVIISLKYHGHEYYGPWFKSVDPKVHDYRFTATGIIASPCSAASGPVEEFQTNGTALGFDEAKVGGTFIKIGVGVLRKDSPHYDYVKQYAMVDPGKWTVKRRRDAVEFTQELSDPTSGYGYIYTKTVRLVAGKPEMVLENSLKNTGHRTIQSRVYNHNFLVLDHQPPGPDYKIEVPFKIRPVHPLETKLAEIRGKQVVYLRALQKEEVVQIPMEGFSDSPKDNQIRIENRKAGAGMLITGNRPLVHLNLWSIRAVLAMEPFISMTVAPGKTFTWKMTYHYYTVPAESMKSPQH